MTKRLFELATQSEWDALEEKSQHTDVAQAVEYLTPGTIEDFTVEYVKLRCAEAQQHKKRESARQLASRKGFKIQTKYVNGWLYLKRI